MTHQVFDKRTSTEPKKEMYVFDIQFVDQNSLPIVVSNEFPSRENAENVARPVAEALGRIPVSMRMDVGRVAIHPGLKGFHAGGFTETKGQMVLYQETIERRISQKHLEESIFHEAVHASWDKHIISTEAWREAQRSDGKFITEYAESRWNREDLAETALLAFGDYQNRLPPDVKTTLNKLVPAKVQFIKDYLSHAESNALDILREDINCD